MTSHHKTARLRRRRRGKRSRRHKKGGSILRAAAVPFGFLALQKLLTRNSKASKRAGRRSRSNRRR